MTLKRSFPFTVEVVYVFILAAGFTDQLYQYSGHMQYDRGFHSTSVLIHVSNKTKYLTQENLSSFSTRPL